MSTLVFAASEMVSGKCGSGLRSLPRAAISSKVWPEPAKNFSALAGFCLRADLAPFASVNLGEFGCLLGLAGVDAVPGPGTANQRGGVYRKDTVRARRSHTVPRSS